MKLNLHVVLYLLGWQRKCTGVILRGWGESYVAYGYRAGIIAGWLPIGEATRNGVRITDIKQMDSKYGRISYYISPKLLYEHTGYMWDGKK